MRRKSKGDREEARRRERSLRQGQDEKIQQECRRARSCWIFRWTTGSRSKNLRDLLTRRDRYDILCSNEARKSKENAMRIRFLSWTKVPLL